MSAVIMKYFLFCLGAALLKLAYLRQPDPGSLRLGTASILHSPEAFLKPGFQLFVMALALLSWATEIVLGFVLIAWWAGLFFWIPTFFLANILMLGRANPAPPFFIGITIIICAAVAWVL